MIKVQDILSSLNEGISEVAAEKLAKNMVKNSRTMAMLERYGIESSEDITRLQDALSVFLERFFRAHSR